VLGGICPCQEVHPVSRVDKKSNARRRVSFPAPNFHGSESNCRPAAAGKGLPELEHPCSTSEGSLCSAPFVAMMQPANLRDFDHLA
jgi:hypothetical protein